MPGPKTHHIFYNQLKSKLSRDTLESFPNYDQYSLFAQGHDFLIYYDYFKIWNQEKLDTNVHNSILLQEWYFQEFIYNFLDIARNNGAIESEQVRLFLGPGYVMHHILDAFTHPLIIYFSGEHERNPKGETWKHGIVENLIDIYMMENYENKNPKKYKVHKDFKIASKTIEPLLIATLNESLEKTYNIKKGGDLFFQSFCQMQSYMKYLKYDRTGIKKKIFDLLDPVLIGTSSFSYHRDFSQVIPFLNMDKKEWLNPMDENIKSTKSFFELYDEALVMGGRIIDQLENLCKKASFNKDDIYTLIPDMASTHGLACGQKCVVNNKHIGDN